MHPEIETFKEEFKKICDIKVGDDAKKLLSEYDDKLAILNNEMNLLKQNL